MIRSGKLCLLFLGLAWLHPAGLRAQPALERLERQLQAPVAQEPAREAGYLGVITRNEAGGGFIRVVEVVPDGPAAQAGVQVDDLILSAEGRLTRQMNDLAATLQGRAPGERVSLAVMRRQQEQTIVVTLGRRPQAAEGPALIAPRSGQAPLGPLPETRARPPLAPPAAEAVGPARGADSRTDQARLDLLERRLAELERRLAELERLLTRRP
jgi:hypothetical protein